MNISERGRRFIQNAEGLRLYVYNDSGGRPTIGYGHLIRPSEIALYQTKRNITLADAERIFDADLLPVLDTINKHVSARLNQAQFDALCAFVFNNGVAAFLGSTLLRDLNTGKSIDMIEHEWMRWVHDDYGKVVPGLVNRRTHEFELFKQLA